MEPRAYRFRLHIMLLAGWNGQFQKDERSRLQGIVSLETNNAFQRQRRLHFSIRYEQASQ